MSTNWPFFSKEEINSTVSVLKSGKVNYWTGTQNKKFEREFALFSNTKFAISLANGTLALELSLKALDIGYGDEVIVTPRTFIASVSSIVNIGAKPVFADVDFETQNISSESIKSVISKNTKAIICVHLAGWPCDMDPILKLAKKNKIFVIEDCAQAHGAKYKGRSVGSLGDVGCWSFCNDKIISTGGEGGMVTTNNKKLWLKMWSYKDHGKDITSINKNYKSHKFRWIHKTFGSNFRMTEFQAAIGRLQLKKINKWNKIRRRNAEIIWETVKVLPNLRASNFKCSDCNGNCKYDNGCVHAAYKCYIFVKGNSKLRNLMLEEINKKNIQCFTGSCPEVYLEKAFKINKLYPKQRLKVAKILGDTSLMFNCHPGLSIKELNRVCKIIRDVSISFNE